MTTKDSSAITEERTFTIGCSRGITDTCVDTHTLTPEDDGVTSLAKAEKAMRDKGWKLHSGGRASCPECIKAWEGE